MSRLDRSRSLVLRRHPFSFLDGLSSAFDYRRLSDSYRISPTPNAADARAIASDFIVTGDDMRAALAEYGRAQ